MCGITGVVNLTSERPIEQGRLWDANQTLFHRGPDAGDVYIETRVGLAVRRLRVVDPESGDQPIANEDGTVLIVYNGEMYTHDALRAELQALGHRFRTRVDTEVVLHAYEQWGIQGCLERLRGMYAFAIWDSRRERLVLARDRMGIKPLYYTETDGRLYFASEIRGMLMHAGRPGTINLAALDAFMRIGFVTAPHTLFDGVHKLPPAHYLVAERRRIEVKCYWSLAYEAPPPGCEKEIIEQFYELLHESVALGSMSEVPLGALLSGGVDSTTLAAIMQRETDKAVRTVSIGFETGKDDETELIKANAVALETAHRHFSFSGNSMDAYPRAMFHMEEPLADAVFTAFYYLYRTCREAGLTVVLNGEGADELLAGYFWHRGEAWARPFLGWPYPLRALLARSPIVTARGEAGRRIGDVLRSADRQVHRRYLSWLRTASPGLSLLSGDVAVGLEGLDGGALLESWSDWITPATGTSDMNKMLWIQSRTRLVDRSNHIVDRMSMAHSIEARVPYQDHKLWEFCARIPTRLKIHGSYRKPVEKYILRQAARGLIPESTRTRKKKGLFVPYDQWLTQRRLPEWAETGLSEVQLKNSGFFDPVAVAAARRRHRAGVPGLGTALMGVLAIQTWAHLFLESPLFVGEPVL